MLIYYTLITTCLLIQLLEERRWARNHQFINRRFALYTKLHARPAIDILYWKVQQFNQLLKWLIVKCICRCEEAWPILNDLIVWENSWMCTCNLCKSTKCMREPTCLIKLSCRTYILYVDSWNLLSSNDGFQKHNIKYLVLISRFDTWNLIVGIDRIVL